MIKGISTSLGVLLILAWSGTTLLNTRSCVAQQELSEAEFEEEEHGFADLLRQRGSRIKFDTTNRWSSLIDLQHV